MRTFPTAFAAQKNLLTGAAPVWILKLTAGGVDYYLSDNAFSVGPWAVTTKAWVKSWGQLQEGISGTLDEFRISDFNLDVLTDPDASPNMETLATTYELEASPVSLYLWFYGCTDPPQEMFRGYIKDITIPDETMVQLSIQDESLRLERAMIGTKVTLQDYPSADPDDVGKVIPIPFGTVSRLPALAVNAGIQTSLPAYISDTATSFTLTSGTGLAAGTVIQVDAEQIRINGISGDTITSCTRCYASTAATSHQMGAVIWERKASFDYLASGIPVASIPKVRAVLGQTEVDITSICTRYTGQTGSVHPSYPGKGVVTIPGYVTAAQAVNLLASGGLTLSQATDVVNYIGVTNGVTASTVIAISEANHSHSSPVIDINIKTAVVSSSNWDNTLGNPFAAMFDGNEWTLSCSKDGLGGSIVFGTAPLLDNQPGIPIRYKYAYLSIQTVNGQTHTESLISDAWQDIPTINQNWTWVRANARFTVSWPAMGAGHYIMIRDVQLVVEVDPSTTNTAATVNGNGAVSATIGGTLPVTGVSPLATAIAGNPAIVGNSTANTLVGGQILCNVVALSTSIPDVYTWLLSAAGYPGTFQAIGTWPACYAYNGAITEYQSALYWLNELAFQARAWFKLSRGTAQLIYRLNTLTPVKALATCRISGGKKVHSRKKTVYDEILNTVSVLYNRDWSQPKGANAYAAVAKGSDSASIANYGPRERADLFQFDFVTDPAMAFDLLCFCLWWYKARHWMHEFDTFLYDAELEFGDAVTLGFTGNAIGQLLETRLAPGSSAKSDTIGMVVVV